MARGSAERLRLVRDIPGDRQGILHLAALGNKHDAALAADKLGTARQLEKMGLVVPSTLAVLAPRQIPAAGHPVFTRKNKLLVKAQHGSAARG